MGYESYALSFDYGQRHSTELEVSKNYISKLTKKLNIRAHKIAKIDLRQFGGSSLTEDHVPVEKNRINLEKSESESSNIPRTYVPARNTIFLSFALAYAETIGANAIFIGANALDYSGYPDCRPEYFEAFKVLANLATASGVTNTEADKRLEIKTPLLHLSKADIIKLGNNLGVDYALTHSCYDPIDDLACGECDSCILRKRGFLEAGLKDPTKYFDSHFESSDIWPIPKTNNSQSNSTHTAVL